LVYGRGDWNVSSSIKNSVSKSSVYPWLSFDRTIEVKTIKLDILIKENNITAVDFIWADVQGAEGEMVTVEGWGEKEIIDLQTGIGTHGLFSSLNQYFHKFIFDFGYYSIPITWGILPKKPHDRIPGTVLTI
jgi:hypothetical protein